MSGKYEELEAVVEAVNALHRARAGVSLGKAQGAKDEELAALRAASRSAIISVESAAVDLAQSEILRERLDAAIEEAERLGMA